MDNTRTYKIAPQQRKLQIFTTKRKKAPYCSDSLAAWHSAFFAAIRL